MTCPKCGTDNPDDFLFCGNCGFDVADASGDEKLTGSPKPQMKPIIKSQTEQQTAPTPKPKIKSQDQQNAPNPKVNKQQNNTVFSTINCPNCDASNVTVERTGRYRCNECGTLFFLENQQQAPDWEKYLIDEGKMNEWISFGWEYVDSPHKGKVMMRRNRNAPSYAINVERQMKTEHEREWQLFMNHGGLIWKRNFILSSKTSFFNRSDNFINEQFIEKCEAFYRELLKLNILRIISFVTSIILFFYLGTLYQNQVALIAFLFILIAAGLVGTIYSTVKIVQLKRKNKSYNQ